MITSVTLLVLSLFALYIGAGWLVKGSTEIALKAKISNLVIGLTIVAFGTSAPELVVSLNASLSGQGDIAVGKHYRFQYFQYRRHSRYIRRHPTATGQTPAYPPGYSHTDRRYRRLHAPVLERGTRKAGRLFLFSGHHYLYGFQPVLFTQT